MKLHYKGNFDGDEEKLPSGQLKMHKNAVKFKEINEINKLMLIMNIAAGIFTIILAGVFILRTGDFRKISIT